MLDVQRSSALPSSVRASGGFNEARFRQELGLVGPTKKEVRGDFAPSAIGEDARKFMKAAGLFGTGHDKELGGATPARWQAMKVVKHGDVNLVVMNLRSGFKSGGETTWMDGNMWEVLVVEKGPKGKPRFKKFEEVFSVPPALTIALASCSEVKYAGNPVTPAPSYRGRYYAQVTGPSVAAVLKSVYSHANVVDGLDAKVIEGKASFDPTPNRTWRLSEATVSLRRGASAEEMDLRPLDIDEDFQKPAGQRQVRQTAPWAYPVQQILYDGKWRDVLKMTPKGSQPNPGDGTTVSVWEG